MWLSGVYMYRVWGTECVWRTISSVLYFFFLMIRRPPRSTQSRSSAASDVYKRQVYAQAGVKGFLSYLIGCLVAFFGSAILTYIVGFNDIEEKDN